MKDITTWTAALPTTVTAAPSRSAQAQGFAAATPSPLDPQEHAAYLQALAGESIGWQPVVEQTYVHLGAPESLEVVSVVGLADPAHDGENVVLINF